MVLLSVGWSTEVCGCLAAPGSNIFFDAYSVCLCVAGMSLCRKILQLFFGPLLVQAMCGAQSLTTSLDHENSYGLLASSSSCFLEGQCCNLLVLWKGIAGCRMRKASPGNLGNISLCGKSQRPLQNQFCRIEQLVLQKLLCKGFWWSLTGLTECVCTLFSKKDFRPSCGNVHMQKPLLPVEGDCVIFLMQSPSISRADFCMCIVQFYKVEDIFPQCFQLPINVFFCLENQVTACYSAAANL